MDANRSQPQPPYFHSYLLRNCLSHQARNRNDAPLNAVHKVALVARQQLVDVDVEADVWVGEGRLLGRDQDQAL